MININRIIKNWKHSTTESKRAYIFVYLLISFVFFLIITINFDNLTGTYHKLFPTEDYWGNRVNQIEKSIEDKKIALRRIPYSIRKLKGAAHSSVEAGLPEDVPKIFEQIEMTQANEFVLIMEIEDLEKELKYALKKLADCRNKE